MKPSKDKVKEGAINSPNGAINAPNTDWSHNHDGTVALYKVVVIIIIYHVLYYICTYNIHINISKSFVQYFHIW